MIKKVIFLGAGSSKAFGLPLTGEIFPLILDGLKNKTIFIDNEQEQENQHERDGLAEFIQSLYPGIDRLNRNDFPMITDTLSLIDHLLNTGNHLGKNLRTQELIYYRNLFEKAIFEVLKVPFNQLIFLSKDETPELLKQFTDYIYNNKNNVYNSVISTNYDIVVEQDLYNRLLREDLNVHEKVDFGFSWRDPDKGHIVLRPQNPIFGIYKLHGSTNWLRCSLCNHIYINVIGSIYFQAFRRDIDSSNTCHCGNAPLSTLIVAPSLARIINDDNLPQIWNNAFEQLRTADEWILIGYSMPPEDLVIKSMFVRAFHARENKPDITVVQKSDAFKSRYEALFGPVTYISGGLEEFLENTVNQRGIDAVV
jgi:hypothetical protein